MLLKGKQVLCSSCGFLAWRTYWGEQSQRLEEFRPVFREKVKAGDFKGEIEDHERDEVSKIHCIREQWRFAPHITGGLEGYYCDVEVVRQSRQCPYYIKYEPGFGPEEHKELKRQAETWRIMIITGLCSAVVGGFIGAAAAIIVRLIST